MKVATAPANTKITVYLPHGQLADVEAFRAELIRDGFHVDRGRMVRAALTVAAGDPAAWVRAMRL